eukprot:CAMPEP_0119273894 /NCGR_PEP_ID=MMETSP1329-20130426/11080_1 /TAXON_ID=114041 /ORGANISM="Genus nov. species nov., Strain RCC1024" /LENGTH=61 /DNA_ID=CAMNT_0007274147 /DNA_START=100 /DNA_END=285 /DNA_ORIENTATION=-
MARGRTPGRRVRVGTRAQLQATTSAGQQRRVTYWCRRPIMLAARVRFAAAAEGACKGATLA